MTADPVNLDRPQLRDDRKSGTPLPGAARANGNRWRGSTGTGGGFTGAGPTVVDVTLTGRCQLRCGFCWGPEHRERPNPDVRRWKDLLRRLAGSGTVRMVFSGGEPLLSPLLPHLLEEARELGMETTLSTNGVLLARKANVLRHVSQIGIPVDAASAMASEVMRPRSSRHNAWQRSIDGIVLAQSQGVPVIVRTVVARLNQHEVLDIPGVLESCGVNLATDRIMLKLYRATRFGPIPSAIPTERWEAVYAVRDGLVEELAAALRVRYPQLSVVTQDYRDTRGRYFLVAPRGDAFGVDIRAGDSSPRMIEYGNVFDDYESAIAHYYEALASDEQMVQRPPRCS
ncbi:radical SAM protein [Streptomyces sp. NPDC127113]|uniref:radical SAM protein n=1 Tax=Streptomyces sp. NPDC127113 TaxID=3345365 RepID=UPI00363BFBC0